MPSTSLYPNSSHAMIFFGICIAVAIMIAVTYMAISKKSTFQVRVVSLICLAVMLLTVIICVVLVVTDTRVPIDPSDLIVGRPDPVKEVDSGNSVILLVFIIFMLIFFVVVMILAIREHKKHLPKMT